MAVIDPLYNHRLANERAISDEQFNEALNAYLFPTNAMGNVRMFKQ